MLLSKALSNEGAAHHRAERGKVLARTDDHRLLAHAGRDERLGRRAGRGQGYVRQDGKTHLRALLPINMHIILHLLKELKSISLDLITAKQ